MSNPVRIGTRDSQLALWQAETVASLLTALGHPTELIPVKSFGDIDLETPLPQMGGKGVFTKALDEALLSGDIDIAVHSYKDLPTDQPLPLKVAAVLKRDDPRDCLVAPAGVAFLESDDLAAEVATSSNRRKAQWLHRYPRHTTPNIRGNVNTRLRKVEENGWHGAIFAAAGLHRIQLQHHIALYLDWMVPAPAQGAVAVVAREEDLTLHSILSALNDPETEFCTRLERDLLNEMEAGCSAPVGAYAWREGNEILISAVALTIDGTLQYDIELKGPSDLSAGLGREAASLLLRQGADQLIEDLRK